MNQRDQSPHRLAQHPQGQATGRQRLVVVSNRLPLALTHGEDNNWHGHAGSGGLVNVLLPILRKLGGIWIGWAGTHADAEQLDQAMATASADLGCELKPVKLSEQDVQDYCQGFSNDIIWPLFHDLQSACNFDPACWRAYCEVNRKFARAIAAHSRAGDLVWVHDYHLMQVAKEMRALGCASRTGFFLHIPFPSLDLFSKLPWCRQLIQSLLQYDLLGFQTLHDRRNFEQCVRAMVPGTGFEGSGRVVKVVSSSNADAGSREVTVGTFPVSIDFHACMAGAASAPVLARARALRSLLPSRTLVLGVDRLDYTKGIPHRLRAFHRLLVRHPELREKISLIQVVVPGREKTPDQETLKTSIDQLVGRINGEYSRPGGWVPVWYVHDRLTPGELLAYYRAADIALVTPLRDGMNLMAKEYCASSIDEERVLILSEFAGAATQLKDDALLVNPYDIDAVADALKRAVEMVPEERRSRMRGLRRSIRRADASRWVQSFMDACAGTGTGTGAVLPHDVPALSLVPMAMPLARLAGTPSRALPLRIGSPRAVMLRDAV